MKQARRRSVADWMRFMVVVVVVLQVGDSGTSGLAWAELKHLVGFGLLKDNIARELQLTSI